MEELAWNIAKTILGAVLIAVSNKGKRLWIDWRINLRENAYLENSEYFLSRYLVKWRGRNDFKTHSIRDYHQIILEAHRLFALKVTKRNFYTKKSFEQRTKRTFEQYLEAYETQLEKSGIPSGVLEKYTLVNQGNQEWMEMIVKDIINRKHLTKKKRIELILQAMDKYLLVVKNTSLSEQDSINGQYYGRVYKGYKNMSEDEFRKKKY